MGISVRSLKRYAEKVDQPVRGSMGGVGEGDSAEGA